MKGRARFIDDNTIVLADYGSVPCPPDIYVYQEDNNKMNENIILKNDINDEAVENCVTTGKLTDVEIFKELKLIRTQLLDSHELKLV